MHSWSSTETICASNQSESSVKKQTSQMTTLHPIQMRNRRVSLQKKRHAEKGQAFWTSLLRISSVNLYWRSWHSVPSRMCSSISSLAIQPFFSLNLP
jgi:hypothetical protein